MQRDDSTFSRIWRLSYPLLTYYGIQILVALLAGILGVTFSIVALAGRGVPLDYYVLMENTLEWLGNRSTLITLATSALVLIPTLVYWRLDEKSRAGKAFVYGRAEAPFYVLALLLGVAACLAMNSLIIMSGLMQVYEATAEEIDAALYQGNLWLEILGVGLVSPLAEEFLFRGVIQGRLKEWTRPETAIVVSSVLFAFYHGNFLQLVYALALGLLFGYLMEKFHHILAPVLAHIGANLVSVIASETGILDQFFLSTTPLILFAGASCLALLGILYLIHEKMEIPLVQKETEEGTERW